MKLPHGAADVLAILLAGMRQTLGDNLVAVYLRGSLSMGDFDPATSDLDFFAITERAVSEAEFAGLAALHARLDALANRYAGELEGPYIDQVAARRFQPGGCHPTVYRGEALAWQEHLSNWVLERWMLRAHGITLCGPPPRELIDPVAPNELRGAVRGRLRDWDAFARDLDNPDWRLGRAHNAYVVETMCRALYTLARGGLASKPAAVTWALATLPEPWRALVERSRARHGDTSADLDSVPEVMRFVQWAAARAGVDSKPA